MAHGILHGTKHGLIHGAKHNTLVFESGPVASIGAANVIQRKYSLNPLTGTLTTAAPIAAWASATAYSVAAHPGINRVISNGNLYQCTQSGTSAVAPSGTGQAIVDGTARWRYLGVVDPTVTTQATGSYFLGMTARGLEAIPASRAISDNKGNTYSVITINTYTSYPSSAMGFYGIANGAGGVGHTWSANWGDVGGTGDELNVHGLEIINTTGLLRFNHVEISSPTGGVVTGTPITVNPGERALLLSVWGGIGAVRPAGDAHPCTPLGGLTSIPGVDTTTSLSLDGYIQTHWAWRRVGPGSYASQFACTEGAKVFQFLFGY